jgi:integrase/recombinase XerD
MNLALWQSRFKEYLELRNYTPRSVEGYVAQLRPFFDFLAGAGVDSLGAVTRDVMEDYRVHLYEHEYRGRRVSIATQTGKLCQIKVFFRFLERDGFVPLDPTAGVQLPRQQRPLPRTVLSEKETERLLEILEGREPIDIRNRAMLEVFYCTGIRNSELSALVLDDVDLRTAELFVRSGKGRKARKLPLGEEAVAWLREYVDHARPHFVQAPNETVLFLSLRGGTLRRNTLAMIVRAAARKAGLKKRVTPHVLRHSCATHMLRNGAGLRQLQELLGHDSPQTTQRYTRLEVSDLRKVLQRCHPREKKS